MHGIYVKKNTMLFMRQTRVPNVSLIFEKGRNDNYTEGARLYQDIIHYCIDRFNDRTLANPFTHRELAKWLLNNNPEYINRYKDPSTKHYTISNRIENTQETTKNKLNHLVSLKIIRVVGSKKVQKGNATTPLYQYTGLGYLLAWLIESFDPDKRERANNKIYQLVDFTFKVKASKSKSSYDIFQVHFIGNTKREEFMGALWSMFERKSKIICRGKGYT